MHGCKQRYATFFLLLACIVITYCYIRLREVRHLTITTKAELTITAVDRYQPRTLSFGDNGRLFNSSLTRYLTALSAEPNDQSRLLSNWTPTFVTATSENHFKEMRAMVHSMQSTYTGAQFVVYDLGLTDEQRSDVLRWCDARFVSFDFDRYPAHVKNLLNYAWKPLIIAEQLTELGTFFWLDASPRLTCLDLSIFPLAVLNGSVEPFLIFGHTEHSIFAATHPGMFKYFPVADEELLKVTEMLFATAIFVSDSSYTRAMLKWVLLCALTEDCIAPGGSELTCKFKDRYKDYGNCHRFDQSLFALARLHLVYLQGYNKLLHPEDRLPEVNSEAKESHMSAEQLKTLSTERERRYQAFVSCFVISRGDEYDGAIPSCNVSSTIDKP